MFFLGRFFTQRSWSDEHTIGTTVAVIPQLVFRHSVARIQSGSATVYVCHHGKVPSGSVAGNHEQCTVPRV